LPIDKAEWEQGRTWETTEGQVLLFLTRNRGKAFTESEIVSGLGRMGQVRDFWTLLAGVATFWGVQNALNNLIKEGKVKARIVKQEIGEDTYYTAL